MPLCLYMASTARRRSLNLTIDLQYSVGGGAKIPILIRRRRFVVTSRKVENVKKRPRSVSKDSYGNSFTILTRISKAEIGRVSHITLHDFT